MADVTASRAVPTWRQFNFFQQVQVKDKNDLSVSPTSLFPTPPYVLISPHAESPIATSVSTILCDANGSLSLLDPQFSVTKRWQGWDVDGSGSVPIEESSGYSLTMGLGSKPKVKAKERVHMLIEAGGILIGIGEDDSPTQSQFPILRVWDLLHDDKQTKSPILMRNVRVGTGGRGYPVSSIAVTPSLNYLAVGLVSGQVLLYRHLSHSLQSSPLALAAFPKARVAWEGTAAEPITGLGFRQAGIVSSSKNGSSTEIQPSSASTGLFIVTTHKIVAVPVVTGKGSEPRVLEELGASLNCSIMDHLSMDLIVGRDDGIYVYDTEGRGACYAYEGPKQSIKAQGNSLVIVSPPFSPSANSQSATIRRAALMPGESEDARSTSAKLGVFDLENKLVSHSSIFKEGIRDIIGASNGSFYVIGGDGVVSQLVEVSIQAKLEALYRKSLFQLAISMAKSAGVDESGVAEIYLRYGDHLYSKGDFDGAMSQYTRTLGWIQPSYVIRKFLDAHRIQHLTLYLQELHSQNLATPDHTTLLLNCYTKTSDKTRLDAFIKSETTRSSSQDDLPFDVDTAIRVCRQAGFSEHAVYLAKRYEYHAEYLKIQLEDLGDFASALTYLRSLKPDLAAKMLARYGKGMLQRQPGPTTDLLIDLCVGNPADTDSSKTRPSPQPFFADYIDHPEEFVRFLETVAKQRWGQEIQDQTPRQESYLQRAPLNLTSTDSLLDEEKSSQRSVWNTLLELYLARSHDPSNKSAQAAARDKASRLIHQADRLPLDPIHALLLCSSSQFEPGLVLLWERLGMYEDIIRFWMHQPPSPEGSEGKSPCAQMLHYLHIYGPTNLHLYPLALRYLTSSQSNLAQHENDVREILQVIDEERIMPPLAVIQLLSRNNVTHVEVIKGWLKARVAETRQDIESDKQLVHSYRSETEDKLREISLLTDEMRPQVFQVTRCASCGGQLDLPSVHFMCKHSYHQRCLPDSDPTCPACARQHAIIRELRRNQTVLADRHDLFLNEVHEANDGFAVIAGAFGKGLLNQVAVKN